jgi:GntR family transcriptional regulator / MocR family aminotransferase
MGEQRSKKGAALMKHTASIATATFVLDHVLSTPLYRQLYERMRGAILMGQLTAGTRLPSTRALARELGVARNTVLLAYGQLLAEGYLESKVGYGTVVARTLPETLLHVPGAALHSPAPIQEQVRHAPLSQRGMVLAHAPFVSSQLLTVEGQPLMAFRAGIPALDAFPQKLWAQIVARRVRHSLPRLFVYQAPAGYRPLREAIASHLAMTRGVRCTADQVLIVAGAQSGFDLAARLLLDPGDAAWVEDPAHPAPRGALLSAGAQLVPVPVDREGLVVAAGIARCPHARLASVTPSHQAPLGVTMSLARRLALLQWASQQSAWILEDDYDSEYRYAGRPLEALQGLDHANRVIYVGTFSKVLFPALRLGYLVVPPELVEAFIAARRFVDRHVSALEQAALADFMLEGHFTRHLRRMRTLYAERQATFVAEIQHHLGDMLEIQPSEVGMHLVAWLPPGMDDKAAARQAAAYGVDTVPISSFGIEPMQRGGLILGYAAVAEHEIRDGVRRLAAALHSLPSTSRP